MRNSQKLAVCVTMTLSLHYANQRAKGVDKAISDNQNEPAIHLLMLETTEDCPKQQELAECLKLTAEHRILDGDINGMDDDQATTQIQVVATFPAR